MSEAMIAQFRAENERLLVEDSLIAGYRAGGPYNVPVEAATADCSPVYRFYKDKDLTAAQIKERLYEGTLPQLLKACCATHAEQRALGYRPVLGVERTVVEDGGKSRPWEFVRLGETVWVTFAALWDRVLDFGAGLSSVSNATVAGARVALYDDTRPEWLVGCYGIWSQAMVPVTVYASLGEDALEYALKEAEVGCVITNAKLAKGLASLCRRAGIASPTIIVTGELSDQDRSGIDCAVFSFEEVVAKGREARGGSADFAAVTPDAVGLIMYTSGTTGDPKGVVLTHGNLHAAVKIITPRLEMFLRDAPEAGAETRYMAYLPLAHILEFSTENACLLRGTLVCYGTPRTLTDATARPHGDLREFKPHVLCGVPRVFDTIKKGAEAKVPAGAAREIFEAAYEDRRACLERGQDTPFYNTKVFVAIRDVVGGAVTGILSGGAPMSAKLQEFMRVTTGASVVQGYGLTETCAITSTQLPGDLGAEELGALQHGVEVKLRDVEDWKHTDVPEPRGEVLVRGPMVAQGYYKQPEKTAEAYTADGWFCTGDVGAITKDGNLKIVGRVKALAKNGLGEYIALDALEATYVLNDLAQPNGVCVLVDPFKAYICALVLTDEAKAMKFAAANGITGTWPTIVELPEFQKKAATSLAETAKTHGKKPFECVKRVRVLADEWTPENGILTAAFKLKRRAVDVRYKDTIAALFATD